MPSLLRETETETQTRPRTAIVTGASRGIGVATAFMELGYSVVANALSFSGCALVPNGKLALVEGNIGQLSTAVSITENAINKFGSIDVVVNNAGIFFTKPFTDYTQDDFRRLSETNLEGYLYVTQLCGEADAGAKDGRERDMPDLDNGSSPHRGSPGFRADDHERRFGGNTLSLALEYAKDSIRFNAVAPGVVDTPMHASDSREHLKSQTPMREISEIGDIVDAVVYLAETRQVTGWYCT